MAIRRMAGSDIPAIARMVEVVWEMDSYGPESSYPASAAYVRQCLASRSFAYVSEIDGVVQGCVIGSRLPNRIAALRRAILAPRLLPLSRLDGYAEFSSDIRIIDGAYDDMLRTSGESFDGQLVLLIVSPELQGRGIGRMLYHHAMDKFKRMGCSQILIFTDDDCGYGFYERDGCELLETRAVRISSEDLTNMMYRKILVVE